ncbi:hypothetical protein DSO57_1036185 [Entomophthora muscae]|uniref:Uncharacterized protein n=2 Tax=Entomophthora muscae TaxID=34485 RepID=A0ACC2TX73_9FUNG|nr:hypothetical protein DSO57_1036185 [Entomophthora muscae]
MVLEIRNYIQVRCRYGEDKILTYYHNRENGESVWELPTHLVPELQIKTNLLTQSNFHPNQDRAKYCEPIPNSDWRTVFTFGGARFFFNPITNERTWEVPYDLRAPPPPVTTLQEAQAAAAPRNLEPQDSNAGTEMTEDDVAYQLAAMGVEMNSPENQFPTYELTTQEKAQRFKDLLADMKISAFDPWDQVIPKIIHDPRFALLPSIKEKKQQFDLYCRDLAKQPSDRRNDPTFNSKDGYRQLVEEHASLKSSWVKFNKLHFSDPRSQAVPYKEREKIFMDYLEALHESRQREKKERKARQARAEQEYRELLDEIPRLGPDSSWRQTRRQIEKDPRYRAIKHEDDREDMFRDYIKNMSRSSRDLKRPEEGNQETEEDRKRRRQEASLRQREKEVRQDQKTLQRQEHHQLKKMDRQNSLALYQTLLANTIKKHGVSFQNALPLLERDERFQNIKLDEGELERLYNEHTDTILAQREQAFRKLVETRCKLQDNSPPPDLLNEPVATQLGDREELERYFSRVQATRIEQAKEELSLMLDQYQYLVFKARAYPKGKEVVLDEAGLKDLEGTLENDSRFTCLDFLPEVRSNIVRSKFVQIVNQERLHVPEISKRD